MLHFQYQSPSLQYRALQQKSASQFFTLQLDACSFITSMSDFSHLLGQWQSLKKRKKKSDK
jgi:hypothetical protein